MPHTLLEMLERNASWDMVMEDWGCGGSPSGLNLLDGGTVNATQINYMHLVNKSATQLNYMLKHAAGSLYGCWSGSVAATASVAVNPTGVGSVFAAFVTKTAAGTTTNKNGAYVSAKKTNTSVVTFYRWKLPSTAASVAGTINYFIVGRRT